MLPVDRTCPERVRRRRSPHRLVRLGRRPSLAATRCCGPDARRAVPRPDPNKAKKQVDKEIDALKDELEDTSASLEDALHRPAPHPGRAARCAGGARRRRREARRRGATHYNDEMAGQLEVAQANEARAVDELAATRTNSRRPGPASARLAAQLTRTRGMGQLSVALERHHARRLRQPDRS